MIYILRINLDIAGSSIRKNPRFCIAISSIKFLVSDKNKIVILAHRGRPSPEKREEKFSLKPLVSLIQREIGKKVVFLDNFDFPKIREEIKEAPGGSVFLLENTRYIKGELENDVELGKSLASLGDRFLNDDFATSHRENASLSAITKFIPSSMGPRMKYELEHLKSIIKSPESPLVVIIGGAKVKDKLGVLKQMLSKADIVLLGGVPANTILKARGVNIGNSLFDQDSIPQLQEIIQSEKVIVPEDFRKDKDIIYDIGPETIKKYASIIKTAKSIIWNGPMGLIEKRRFAKGTRGVAKAVLSNRKAKMVIGGGDTLSGISLRSTGNNSNILISTGGGAMLAFLAGETLPALETLDKNPS
jgi:phosphoglycerate kinase